MISALKALTNVCLTVNSVAAAGLTAICLTCPDRYAPAFNMSLVNCLLESAVCLCLLGLCHVGQTFVDRAAR